MLDRFVEVFDLSNTCRTKLLAMSHVAADFSVKYNRENPFARKLEMVLSGASLEDLSNAVKIAISSLSSLKSARLKGRENDLRSIAIELGLSGMEVDELIRLQHMSYEFRCSATLKRISNLSL